METHVTVDGQPLLTERLRLLKQRTGLSLAALASVTPFSKSTWHRYLNGDQLPPRAAVEALARLAHTDPGPLLALWDAAVREQQSRPARPQPEPPVPSVRRSRLRPPTRALVALAVMATTVAVTVGATDVLDHDAGAEQHTVASCRGDGCQGELPSSRTCTRDARTERAVTGNTGRVRDAVPHRR
jgi:transcriptional regulator with XRE-family HTH domain